MKQKDFNPTKAAQTDLELDPELRQVLSDFRAHAHAWSEAAANRPRTIAPATHRTFLRPAVSWALAAVLAAGTLSGSLYHRHQVQAAAARAAEQQRQIELQRARQQEEEKLLARVDSDVSRQVPQAMEPLAELMDSTDWQ